MTARDPRPALTAARAANRMAARAADAARVGRHDDARLLRAEAAYERLLFSHLTSRTRQEAA